MVHDGPLRLDGNGESTALFGRQLSSAGAARRWTERQLDELKVAGRARQEIVLVVSELVTNALRHGRGDIVVRLSPDGTDASFVQLAVTDSGPELPAAREIDPERIGGLGLQIVGEVAARWGVSPFPGGKTVWALLPATR